MRGPAEEFVRSPSTCLRARGTSESLNPAARGGESLGGRVAVCSVPGAGPGALQIKRIERGTSRSQSAKSADFSDVVK